MELEIGFRVQKIPLNQGSSAHNYFLVVSSINKKNNKENKKLLISMEKAKNTSNLNIQLPPGFRFHPTDEELIVHYLQKKVSSSPISASIFAEIELYKFNPWELPHKALFGEDEWYFFSPRDRKYPNGVRPNRMAGSGYWKATGTDRPIFRSSEDKIVGVKKALVFYEGKPPRGNKTDWIMHEYRLLDSVTSSTRKPKESMRLDDWVLCRVRQKTCTPGQFCDQKYDRSIAQSEKTMISFSDKIPNLEILKKENLFKDCPMLPFIFDSHLDFPSMDDTTSPTTSFEGTKTSFVSYENRGTLQESFDNMVNYDRKRKEMNQEEAFIDPYKKLRTMESQSEETGFLEINSNETSFHGGDQYETWRYMMGYRDLNHLAFM